MKVAHINFGDSFRLNRGTAVATIRLHKALQQLGVTSEILCGFIDEENSHINRLPRPAWSRFFEVSAKPLIQQFGLNDLHNFSSFSLKFSASFQNIDLLHLHCIHHGYFNYLALPFLTEKKPAIYTIHDLWAFTGHCTYPYQCERWKIGCGQCPDLTIPPAVKRDNTRLEWNLKRWAYQHSNLSIVSPSTWVTQMLKDSMMKDFPIYQIPHGIDTKIFRPLDQDHCRSVLNIPRGKKVLMFVSTGSKAKFGKGDDLLIRSLQTLPASLKQEICLLTMGNAESFPNEDLGMEIRHLGLISIDTIKPIAYSAADLFLFPTRSETFGLVALESQACMTPVISFASGGISDIVQHGQTGFLATPGNSEEFKQGIVQLLEDKNLRKQMGRWGRQVTLNEFSIELEAQRYNEVYRKALNIQNEELRQVITSL